MISISTWGIFDMYHMFFLIQKTNQKSIVLLKILKNCLKLKQKRI